MAQSLQTNWCVLTGGPHTGKTKTLERLAYLGHSVRPEVSRIHIDNELSKGRTLKEIRSDGRAFQLHLVKLKRNAHKHCHPDRRVFWDRGLPDSLVYMNFEGMDVQEIERESQEIRYAHVFLLAPIPVYQVDYARTESAAKALEVHAALEACYQRLGYTLHHVPVLPIEERVKQILSILT